MDNQNNIQDELRHLNSGLPLENSQSPFSVPEGYFDGLAASILAKVKGQEDSATSELQAISPLLAGISKQMPYSVPQGYFDDNLITLPYLLEDEQSPVLSTIGKGLPYRVPTGYFENLPVQILTHIAAPKAKVVPLFARTWLRVAVAAVMGGLVLFGGYRLLNNGDSEQPLTAQSGPVDTTEQLVARNQPAATVTQDIKEVSTEELDAFINTVPFNPAKLQQTKTNNSVNQSEVSELLKDVSREEIDAFLEQIPTADDDLLVID